jgi:hypothetical protein
VLRDDHGIDHEAVERIRGYSAEEFHVWLDEAVTGIAAAQMASEGEDDDTDD